MASRKNKWRRIGPSGIEVQRVTRRFSDGSAWEPRQDILWFRTPKTFAKYGSPCRRGAYVYSGLDLGLDLYLGTGKPKNAVTVAHAIKSHLAGEF